MSKVDKNRRHSIIMVRAENVVRLEEIWIGELECNRHDFSNFKVSENEQE